MIDSRALRNDVDDPKKFGTQVNQHQDTGDRRQHRPSPDPLSRFSMARRKRRRRVKRIQQVFEGTVRTRLPRVMIDDACEWAAIRVPPTREMWLRRNVLSRSPDVAIYRPEIAFRAARRGHVVTITRNAAPGYLFIGSIDLDSAFAALRMVNDWLDDEPTPLEVFGPISPKALQTFSDHLTGELGLSDPDLPFLPNQRVVVDDGPMIGTRAIVQGMPDPQHVLVDLLMFSRHIVATFAPAQLRAA